MRPRLRVPARSRVLHSEITMKVECMPIPLTPNPSPRSTRARGAAHRSYCRFTVSIVLCCISLFPCLAEDKPAEAQPVKHRVTGLFSADREADLQLVFKEKMPEIKLVSVDFKNGEATFVYDADKIFSKPNPEQLIERFDNQLRTHTLGTFGIKALCTIPRDKLTLVEIPVVGLDCKGCSLAAYEAIYQIEGVEQATASFKLGLVTAWINAEKTDRTKLESALKQRGVELKAK